MLPTEVQNAVGSPGLTCVILKIPGNHAIEKMEDSNEIGFTRAIAADKDV